MKKFISIYFILFSSVFVSFGQNTVSMSISDSETYLDDVRNFIQNTPDYQIAREELLAYKNELALSLDMYKKLIVNFAKDYKEHYSEMSQESRQRKETDLIERQQSYEKKVDEAEKKLQQKEQELLEDISIKYALQIEYLKNNDIRSIIKSIVEQKINNWQQKGEYEKLAIYQNRVNNVNRTKKIEEYQSRVTDSLINDEKKYFNYDLVSIGKYDTENETFLMSHPNYEDFILKVPINQAEFFKKNLKETSISRVELLIIQNKFVISHLYFFNSILYKVYKRGYKYDIEDETNYSQINIDYNFSDIEIDLPKTQVSANTVTKTNDISVGKPDVDMDIPLNNKKNPHRYALIIGNEDYSSFQTGLSTEVNVDYAINDAKVFSEYCEKTLGVDSRHLKLLSNATYGQMKQSIAWVQNLSDVEGGNAEIIFYYSGHGLPNEVTKEGYLMPVDVSGNNVSNGISLKYLYQELNKYPAKKITVVLDACFSGGARNEGLIAMKGMKINPKEEAFAGNMVVFASSSGNESSAVYRDKQHGYLTYFLLKKIQETKGYVNYKDLSDYLDYQVRKETAIIGKVQTPKVNVSPSARDQWKYWSFR